MTEREVLKLALEALEVNLGTWSAKKKAIPAIKEVLAQPEPSELDIWKSRALQAEAVVEKFMAQPEFTKPTSDHCMMENAQGELERIKLVQTGVGIGKRAEEAYKVAKERGWVGVSEEIAQPEQHQDWCASLTQMLASMPPQPAPCNCKPEPVIDKSAAIRIATSLGWEPKRTWVGLTEKDFSAINQSSLTKLQAATSAESILKEKNS